MPSQTSTTPFEATRNASKKPYKCPALIEYGDINAVTRDLDSGDLLSVTVVAVV
jgi:hypothetical protein